MPMHRIEIGRNELEKLLEGTWEYTDPPSIFKGLSAEDACAKPEGWPYTIAELVRHLHYWQQEQLLYARGINPPKNPDFKYGVTDFVPVAPAEWEGLRDEFLASYAELLQCAEDPALMAREPNENCNVGFMLANHALHNAYHLGQIVLMRRIMGNWVPVH